jgi:hypothetical protein
LWRIDEMHGTSKVVRVFTDGHRMAHPLSSRRGRVLDPRHDVGQREERVAPVPPSFGAEGCSRG